MFTPKQKRIYKWNDGTKDRRSDPLAIETEMVRVLGAAYRSLDKAMIRYHQFRDKREQIGEKMHDGMCLDSLEAQAKYVKAIRVAFKVGDPCDPADDDKPSFDSEQCMDLIADYFRFMVELETAARPLPQSLPSLDLEATNSPTENSSDSIPSDTNTTLGVPSPSLSV